ncbi:alpha/beta hydrolase [Marinitenerispora sediminis]|uniref:Carboxylesterase n=1 Tax=Marinitenerispora sediminis TaxID=1931232 RepID=A0A368TBX7_9ACTN|nr:alpha/beta fold hydrolase [Marinitenerispora sediminis]RCV55290.1 carboxylesterase [Marinitenerispora sediminis]RCV61605.1 carboxylesterase [Marinitenerispora sediminis]RCV62664.1 carboxylesterase [Marinitenerispora sediminis]
MPLLPGAAPFRHDGGPVGVLLCHGFTGSPQSLRPWAQHLAAAGLTVDLPLLPGHGTRWQDMNATTADDWAGATEAAFAELRERCAEVFVMGLSVGGCLALRLAAAHPGAVSGVVVVNPSLALENPLLLVASALRGVLPSTRGVVDDIKKPGAHEVGYERVPTAAAATLPRLWRTTRRGLGRITAPILVYRSPEDHVIGPASLRILTSRAVNAPVTVRSCDDSYHVATLDNDAATIFGGSLAFVRDNSRSGEGLDA